MEEYETENIPSDINNQSDDESESNLSESDICSSSCYSESTSEELSWWEDVKPDGSLFYIDYDTEFDPYLEEPVNRFYQIKLKSYMKQSTSTLNAAEKLIKWMKDKKKRVRKSFPLRKANGSDTDLNSSLDKFSRFQSKDIFIDVDSTNISEICKLSLSEKLFGLKLGSLEETCDVDDKPCILGIVPSEDVPDVKVGDWLNSINDFHVNMCNIDNVLSEIPIPSKVKLNILSHLNQNRSELYFLPPKHTNLLKELLGDSSAIEYAKSQYQSVPHGLFFLSIENGTFENSDVIYRYPDDDTALFKFRAMFLTLSHMIHFVASPPLLSCSVWVQGEIIHVGSVKEEDSIMILAFPASVASVAEVQHFSAGLAKLFKYQFLTLKKTFTTEDKNYLDNFLALFFEHYLSSSYAQNIFSVPHLLDILPSAHFLPLPNDLKDEIDAIMSELESSDFGIDSGGFLGIRRSFNIFGSCLFYKGYLLCSHLPKNDLLDIHLFLHYNHILELTHMQPVSQIIIFKEVFPSKQQKCLSNYEPIYKESQGRWFMLIVVMEYFVLAVLLDDSGCAFNAEKNRVPEPFYVKEVENTLFILQDCGITAAIEKLLHFYSLPVTSPDLLCKGNSSHNSLSSVFASNVCIHSSGPDTSSGHSATDSSLICEKEVVGSKIFRCSSTEKIDEAKRQQLLSSIGPADGESDTESSYSNDSNEIDPFRRSFRSYSISNGSTTESQADKDFETKLTEQNSSSLPNLSGITYSDGICFENSFR